MIAIIFWYGTKHIAVIGEDNTICIYLDYYIDDVDKSTQR